MLKKELGLFENPYVDPEFTDSQINKPETQALGLDASRESIILLKNENNLLPLNLKKLKRIAVIGPNAATLRTGDYSPNTNNNYRTSILDGIRQGTMGEKVQVDHVWGCDIYDSMEMVPVSSDFLMDENGSRGLTGRYYNSERDEKPVFIRTDRELAISWFLWAPRHAQSSIKDSDSFFVEWNGHITSDVSVLGYIGLQINGDKSAASLYIDDEKVYPLAGSEKGKKNDVWMMEEPLRTTTQDARDKNPRIQPWTIPSNASFSQNPLIIQGKSFAVPYFFVKGVSHKIRIEYKKRDSHGDIRLVWNLVGRNGIEDAYAHAAEADVAIVVVGDNGDVMGETRDRTTLELLGKQHDLIKAVYSTGTPTIVILSNGRPPQIPWEADHIPAIIEAFYGGQSSGIAVADVLFGKYNPAGRLPISFPRSVGALPDYYNGPPTFYEDGYLDGSYNPVYPFGYGLSYTQFRYEDFDCFPRSISRTDLNATFTFSFKVSNIGSWDGDEVPQLYRLGHVSSVTVPVKQLFGFTRVHIKSGSSVNVQFTLHAHQWLGVWNRSMQWDLEAGKRDFVVGPNAKDEWAHVSVYILP